MKQEEILVLIQSACREEVRLDAACTPVGYWIHPGDLIPVCTFLHENPATYVDMLSCITGIDNGVESNTMEVNYLLYSIPFNISVMLKVTLSRTTPQIESLTNIWKSANWLERETYDMFGIQFEGHPDLRRILMPDDWEGFPLRKDYQHQELYRGITVKYERH
jgi:NADH-quinone oxidoreductase subunit C